MKALHLFLFFFFLNSSAWASGRIYDLRLSLSSLGKPIASPFLVIEEGQKGTIIQEVENQKSFIEIIATEKVSDIKPAVMLKFVIGTIGEDGKRKIISRPMVVAFENEPAEINVFHENGEEIVTLSVLASRKFF